ncbi:MAG: enoyl-CoA hydratase-related protein [Alphaproteobacteria bacterium]
MTYSTIRTAIDARGVATLTLARPEVHNAMNGEMYDEARAAVAAFQGSSSVRAIVLTGEGRSFCAGGDLKYQRQQAARPQKERIAEASKLALWLRELDQLSKPLIGRINGAAYAGGLGLISVCDVAIGLSDATFAITEARLGLLPGMISPYVVRRLGISNARRYFLTGRPFSGERAAELGLLDEAVTPDELDAAVAAEVDLVLGCAPGALTAAKRLIDYVAHHPFEDNLVYTVDRVAEMWSWEEAAEGMASFAEKRKPAWAVPRT